MRSGILSQRSALRVGEVWQNLGDLVTARASAFWIDCNLLMEVFGRL